MIVNNNGKTYNLIQRKSGTYDVYNGFLKLGIFGKSGKGGFFGVINKKGFKVFHGKTKKSIFDLF